MADDFLGMVTRNLLEVKNPWPRVIRSWNARLIPEHLKRLALFGVYYDDKML